MWGHVCVRAWGIVGACVRARVCAPVCTRVCACLLGRRTVEVGGWGFDSGAVWMFLAFSSWLSQLRFVLIGERPQC